MRCKILNKNILAINGGPKIREKPLPYRKLFGQDELDYVRCNVAIGVNKLDLLEEKINLLLSKRKKTPKIDSYIKERIACNGKEALKRTWLALNKIIN